MIPLGVGVCLLFAGAYKRWANLLVWASLSAVVVGVLNSIRFTFMPTTLWALGTYIVMIAAGGGLMFRSLGGCDDNDKPGAA
jgi:zinc transporter ZupT